MKHGMDPDADEPLRISVRTAKTDAACEIVVEDNGPGLRPGDDKQPQVALANIRERLLLMCGGTPEIAERESGGTRVTVRIPVRATDCEKS